MRWLVDVGDKLFGDCLKIRNCKNGQNRNAFRRDAKYKLIVFPDKHLRLDEHFQNRTHRFMHSVNLVISNPWCCGYILFWILVVIASALLIRNVGFDQLFLQISSDQLTNTTSYSGSFTESGATLFIGAIGFLITGVSPLIAGIFISFWNLNQEFGSKWEYAANKYYDVLKEYDDQFLYDYMNCALVLDCLRLTLYNDPMFVYYIDDFILKFLDNVDKSALKKYEKGQLSRRTLEGLLSKFLEELDESMPSVREKNKICRCYRKKTEKGFFDALVIR